MSGIVQLLMAGKKPIFGDPYTDANKFNLVGNPLDILSWNDGFGGARCTLTTDPTNPSPLGSAPMKMAVTGDDPYIQTYNSSTWNIAPASSGQTWQVKVLAKASASSSGEIFIFGCNSSGGIIDFAAGGFSIQTEWGEKSYNFTFSDANVAFIQIRLDGPPSGGAGVDIWWDALQVYNIT